MASKQQQLVLKQQQQLTLTGQYHKDSCNKFSELDLNRGHKCLTDVPFVHSFSKTNKDKNFGCTVFSEKSNSWNRLATNYSSFKTLKNQSFNVESKERAQKRWMNEKNDSSNSRSSNGSSTLSLHIPAYENFVEASENEDFPMKSKAFNTVVTVPESKFQDPYEFPRQMDGNDRLKPQVQQFKASQRLFSPNQGAARSSSHNQHPPFIMSRPSNQKRLNYYSQNQGYKAQKLLDWHKCGIWFTCEFEKDGVREAQNIVGKFLNEPSVSEPTKPSPAGGDASGEMDIADELKQQIEEANRPRNLKRIHQQPTGVKHCLFFTVADIPREKIADFVEKLVDDCQQTQQCRYLLRALPIEDISPAEVGDLKSKLRQILKRHFDEFSAKPENEGKHASFAVDYKKRYSDQIERQQALDIVCEVVAEMDPESKVNLTQPDFTILFHVVRKAVLLGCLKSFNQRRKFALKIQDEKQEGESSPAKKKKDGDAEEVGEEEKDE